MATEEKCRNCAYFLTPCNCKNTESIPFIYMQMVDKDDNCEKFKEGEYDGKN